MASSQPGNLQQPANSSNCEDGQPEAVEGEVWDEERLEKAMKTMKEMHIQLRDLRTTLPRLIAPLTKKQPSPETLFREFSASANSAIQEVQEFRRLVTSDDSKKVMEQARKSRAENPKGIKPWKASDHPDWLRRET
ncbi:hypothetical protein ONS95_013307 [Cadophora gregata]|uniref:uncharacterized protein n=1 Tax=Cadophora gregata TaxID=51156 RepID=UPI0026DB50A8|nr:uncharacterized protein ONS95_013307 [Cadophora gregata]KAK0099865.1 hypothetical protein ONS96_007818 [Cadophora gregata f. sp. sojae]KAK0116284.1 hypothetical protein ONS95_013307 [Cadophora gregata]